MSGQTNSQPNLLDKDATRLWMQLDEEITHDIRAHPYGGHHVCNQQHVRGHRPHLRALRRRRHGRAARPPGVSEVEIDLVAGGVSTVTVTASAPLTEEQVTAALDEAGNYHLANI